MDLRVEGRTLKSCINFSCHCRNNNKTIGKDMLCRCCCCRCCCRPFFKERNNYQTTHCSAISLPPTQLSLCTQTQPSNPPFNWSINWFPHCSSCVLYFTFSTLGLIIKIIIVHFHVLGTTCATQCPFFVYGKIRLDGGRFFCCCKKTILFSASRLVCTYLISLQQCSISLSVLLLLCLISQ